MRLPCVANVRNGQTRTVTAPTAVVETRGDSRPADTDAIAIEVRGCSDPTLIFAVSKNRALPGPCQITSVAGSALPSLPHRLLAFSVAIAVIPHRHRRVDGGRAIQQDLSRHLDRFLRTPRAGEGCDPGIQRQRVNSISPNMNLFALSWLPA
jgi:hypothetical protein